jgi:predicted transposase YdaD
MGKHREIIDHDQIFKTLLKEFFAEFMQLFLPEIARKIDFSKIEFLEKEFFTDINDGRKKLLDLVIKVQLVNGTEEYILIHTEFESKKPSTLEFPKRMFKYFCQLFLRFGKPVIPIVIFTDDHRWRTEFPDSYSIEFNNKCYLKYYYHSIKLKHYNWRKFLDSNNPLAYALMAKMDYAKSERVKLKADFLRLILKAEINSAKQSILVDFIENYVRLTSKEQQVFETLVTNEEDYIEVIKMMTVYEARGIEQGMQQGIEQGMQQGMQQGIQQGIQQGAIEIAQKDVIEVLILRFKTIPVAIKKKIERCESLNDLKLLHRQAVLINNINELKLS